MESKRKASGANGLEIANDVDRAAKRRKLIEEYGDLADGESSGSTTAFGLSILESLRATTDKNGRLVSPYFETLLPRAEHADYYQKIRLPLSLQVIERKLKDQQYPTLSTLESDLKRMVLNAKDTHDRSSTIYNDAERLRKAVSNLMVKHNPAYKSGTYQAVPTPLPPSPDHEGDNDNDQPHDTMDTSPQANGKEESGLISRGDDDGDVVETQQEEGDEEGDEDMQVKQDNADEADGADEVNEDDDADEAEEEGLEAEEAEEADAEAEADEAGDADEGDNDNENENDEDEDEEDGKGNDENEEVDDDDKVPQSRRRRRRGSSRRKRGPKPSRDSATASQKLASRPAKADHYYEDVPFKGLSFQQAQEKIVEELIRRKEDSDDYPYFEPFIFLPPRTLKDYYEIIQEPLSLKQLQKQVRGQHGRSEATRVSDFKGWAAFEDQASLIWRNAYHYNEDGSDIFVMAQELEEAFQELLKEAKESVQEPLQPKIKLKLPPSADSAGHPKKITIHVGGKSSGSGSPAPATGQSGDSELPRNEGTRTEMPMGRGHPGIAGSAGTSVNLGHAEQARSMSTSAGPASPSVMGTAKTEDSGQTASASRPQPMLSGVQPFVPGVAHPGQMPNGTTAQYQPPPQATPPPPPPPPRRSPMDILEAQKFRPTPIREGEALMPKLVITTHPTLKSSSNF